MHDPVYPRNNPTALPGIVQMAPLVLLPLMELTAPHLQKLGLEEYNHGEDSFKADGLHLAHLQRHFSLRQSILGSCKVTLSRLLKSLPMSWPTKLRWLEVQLPVAYVGSMPTLRLERVMVCSPAGCPTHPSPKLCPFLLRLSSTRQQSHQLWALFPDGIAHACCVWLGEGSKALAQYDFKTHFASTLIVLPDLMMWHGGMGLQACTMHILLTNMAAGMRLKLHFCTCASQRIWRHRAWFVVLCHDLESLCSLLKCCIGKVKLRLP